MRPRVHALLLGVCTVLVATLALAATLEQVTDDATALNAVYSSLLNQAAACPEGHCTARAQIEADFASAEIDRAQLSSDRQTLNPCGNCSSVDSLISAIDTKATTLGQTINGWDQQW